MTQSEREHLWFSLQPYDWIQYQTDNGLKYDYVTSIISPHCRIKGYYAESMSLKTPIQLSKEWEPVPLTPWILAENEFYRDYLAEKRLGMIMGGDFKGFYKVPQCPDKGFYLEHWGDHFSFTDHRFIRIKYVHELQHLLQACGWNPTLIVTHEYYVRD